MEDNQSQTQNDPFVSLDKKPTTNGWAILAYIVMAISGIDVLAKFINFVSATGSDVTPLFTSLVTFFGVLIPCGVLILLTQLLDELKKMNKTKKAQSE